jgi:ubiquitin-activating enzyme E1
MATTTAMICGFVALEMYKVHAIVPKMIGDFRVAFINMAINTCALAQPLPCRVQKAGRWKFTLWTTWSVEGDLTVRELIQAIHEKYGVTPEAFGIGRAFIWGNWDPRSVERMDQKVTQLSVEMGAKRLGREQNTIDLMVCCIDADGEDVDVPAIILKVKRVASAEPVPSS